MRNLRQCLKVQLACKADPKEPLRESSILPRTQIFRIVQQRFLELGGVIVQLQPKFRLKQSSKVLQELSTPNIDQDAECDGQQALWRWDSTTPRP